MSHGMCSTPGCGGQSEGGKRGKCRACYQALRRLVAAGETTWEQLVTLGRCEPVTDAPRKAFIAETRRHLAELAKQANGKSRTKSGVR